MHEWKPSGRVEAAGDDKNAHMNHFRLNQMKFKSQKKEQKQLTLSARIPRESSRWSKNEASKSSQRFHLQ